MLMRKRRAKETHNKGAEKCPLASFKWRAFWLTRAHRITRYLQRTGRWMPIENDIIRPPLPFPRRIEPNPSRKRRHIFPVLDVSYPKHNRRRPAQGKRSGGHLDAMHRISISVTYLLVRYAVLLFDTILYSAIISISTEPCFITYINIACSACHPTTYFFLSFISVYSLDPFEN
jgi:hypothetical protein